MRRWYSLPFFALPILFVLAPATALAATRQVGPGKTYAKPCAAIAAAQAGDVIEVDAAGNYDGDHCTWSTDNLTVRGVNGRAKIDAGKNPANTDGGKGIFVIMAPNATVESFELMGATVVDQNGAGIRHQGTNLTVRDVYFHDNDDGILGAPATDGTGEVTIESSEFANNGFGDGQSHNMYLNHYAKFTLRFSYSHGAKVGHLVKTRALENHILYNRLTDEAGTTASYELSFPNAGLSYVIGNVIQQSNETQNPAIVDYASEPNGMNADGHLFVVNNTIVNDRAAGGTFVANKSATPAILTNNIMVGGGTVTDQASAVLTTNFTTGDAKLVAAATYDYHLLAGSPCANAGTDPGQGSGQPLAPGFEYVHPRASVVRTSVGVIDIGAFELGNPGAVDGGAGGDGGSSGSSGSSGTSGSSGSSGTSGSSGSSGSSGTSGSSGSSGTAGDGGTSGGSGSSSGCSCRVHDAPGAAGALVPAGLALLAFGARRRRRG